MSGGVSVWIIVPCYNEEGVILAISKLLLGKVYDLINRKIISDRSRILYVNDGSTDTTWKQICGLSKIDGHYIGISQSRNFGHQNAIYAGLMEAKAYCDCAITMDCDGQDDIDTLEDMVKAYQDGFEVVYGVRLDRKKDSFLKRNSAIIYYHLLRFLGGEVVFNHADFRLASKSVINSLEQYGEVNLFLRGIFPLMGYKSTCVYYERKERMGGSSHYSLRKMFSLGLNGITSLSIRPIRFITILGFISSMIGFVGIVYAIMLFMLHRTVIGWASMVCMNCFMGGIQLLCLGILGEYIGKIYLETKRRPRYIISERTWDLEDKRLQDKIGE